jgi:hypothetical protein
MKRVKFIICILVLISLVVTVYIASNAISRAKQIGIDAKNSTVEKIDLASVDGIIITSIDVENYRNYEMILKLYYESADSSYTFTEKTDQEILNHLIENAVLYLEAEKQGLVVSDRDVDNFTEQTKEDIIKADDQQLTDMMKEYLSGKGLTMNEYIDNNKLMYKQLLSIGVLRGKYVVNITSSDARIEEWNNIKKELMTQYQSVIIIK